MAEPLRIRFATDVESAKAGVANLAASIAGNAVKMGSALKAVNDNAEKVGGTLSSLPGLAAEALPALLAIGGAIAVYQAVNAAIQAAKDSVAEFVQIGNQARDAAVSGTFLQRWQGEARVLNVEVTQLTAMLDRARSAATASIGEKSATPFAKPDVDTSSPGGRRLAQNVLAGNLTSGDVAAYQNASSQEDRIRAVLDLIDKLQAAQKNLAAFDLAKTFFGDDFEKRLREGVNITGELRDAINGVATTAGGKRVISDEELANAREINAQLVAIDNLMAQGLAPIQEDLTRLGQEQYKGWLDIKQGIAEAVAAAGALYVQVKDILRAIDEFTGRDPLGKLATTLGAQRVREALGIVEPKTPNTEVFGPPMPPSVRDSGISGRGDRSNALPSLKTPAGSTQEEKSALDRFVQQLEKSNALAQTEVENIGKSNQERAVAVALTKARVAAEQDVKDGKRDTAKLSDEELANITHLAEVEQRARDIAGDLNQKLRQNAEAVREFGQLGADAFAGMVLEGKSFNDVLGTIAQSLAKAAIQAVFTGQGPLAGILGLAAPASSGPNAVGGIFGSLSKLVSGVGANADGTDNWRGGLSLVGERGPEIVNIPRGAQVVPNDILRAGGGGNVTVQMGDTHISAPGGDPALISAMLDQRDRAMAAKLPALIRSAQGRGSIR